MNRLTLIKFSYMFFAMLIIAMLIIMLSQEITAMFIRVAFPRMLNEVVIHVISILPNVAILMRFVNMTEINDEEK